MIQPAARSELAEALGDAIRFETPAARLCSLRVGGAADAVATPEHRHDLARLLRICARHRVPHVTLGGGFNVLVRDGGLRGVAIRLTRFRSLEERPEAALRVEAGVTHASLTRFCQEHGLSGLEFGAGIPGSIGGWLAMNAGVPGAEVGDRVRELEVMSPTGGRRRHLPHARLHFRYRGLRGLAPGSVIVSALLDIQVSTPEKVAAEVARHLARRADTQPLDVPSCGSVFKNPPGDFAGRLIEAAGLKGARAGAAQISPLHANFIVNRGGATAADVLELIERARRAVAAHSGIRLETEVRVLGESAKAASHVRAAGEPGPQPGEPA